MPSLWQHSLALLRAPGNQVAFALRRRLQWSRGALALGNEAKGGLFAALPEGERRAAAEAAERLERRHDLTALRRRSTQLVFAENLALLDRLSALQDGAELPCGDDGVVRAIDVGCGAFAYATALQRWLRGGGTGPRRPVMLRGIEVDGFGIYRDGHSRADHARAHAALAGSDVRFQVADFTRLDVPQQDVVTLLFPFLSSYPLLRWGLPLTHLRPRLLLSRAVAAVRPGGWLVVGNQSGAEFERLAELLAELPVALSHRVSFASALLPYAERAAGRVGSLWRRQNALPEAGTEG